MIKNFVAEWKEYIRARVQKLKRKPVLTIVQVGNIEASNRYVRNKIKDCEEVGIIPRYVLCSEDIDTDGLINEVVNAQWGSDGVIVQLPLPPEIDTKKVLGFITGDKDVDGLGPAAEYEPCTPGGIMAWLKERNFEFEGANAVVIGRSELVGKPMAEMLLRENATVTVAHSKTPKEKLDRLLETADLVICAVGKADFLDCSALRREVVVVDVGINFKDGKIVGDTFGEKSENVTPVPGGVGLLTRCMLLANVTKAREKKESGKG